MIQFSLCLIAVAIAALALFVWRAKPDAAVNRWFVAFTLAIAGWIFGVATSFGGAHLVAWARFTLACGGLIPTAFLLFDISYPTSARRLCAIGSGVALFF